MIGQIARFVKGFLSHEVEIEFQVIPAREIRLEVVAEITEAEYVWSDFFSVAIPVGSLRYSHTDSSGVAGYRITGTNTLVWRDQLSSVQFVVEAA